MRAAISSASQRPPASVFVAPFAVTMRISAMRPPPTKNVLSVMSFARSLAR